MCRRLSVPSAASLCRSCQSQAIRFPLASRPSLQKPMERPMGAGFSIKAKANSEADVYIYEDVGAGWFGGVTAKQFADDLKGIGEVSKINLRINSAGGDVF